MEIIESILTNSSCYLKNRKIKPQGLMYHSVGCNQPKAEVFLRTWNKPGVNVCPHAVIDGLTGKIYQCLPWNHRGWHGGGSSNDTHIGVETGEPDCIHYKGNTDRFTCTDFPRAREIALRTYKSNVQLFAYLCKEFELDPLKKGVIISHNEGGRTGVASRHTDPEHLWSQLGMNLTMDGFRKEVAAAMEEEQPVEYSNIYRVQIGAFGSKDAAEEFAAKARANGYPKAFVTLKGDYDGDGAITSADARVILRRSVGLDE